VASIIDSLLVTLGLDTKDFDKGKVKVDTGLKDSAENARKRGGEVEASAKKQGEAFAKLRGELVGLLAAYVSAKSIVGFAKNTMDVTAAIGNAGQAFGRNVGDIAAWSGAIKAAGGDANEAINAFDKISAIRAAFVKDPGSLNTPIMGRLGITSAKDFDSEESLMLTLANNYQQRLKAAGGDPHREQLATDTFRSDVQQILGVSNNWVKMLMSGTDALKREIEEQKRLNPLTKEQADNAREAAADFAHFNTALMGLFNSIEHTFPMLRTTADLFDFVASGGEKANASVRAITIGFWALMNPLTVLLDKLAQWGIISPQTANAAGQVMRDTNVYDLATGTTNGPPKPYGQGPGDLVNPNPSNAQQPGAYTGRGATKADRNNNPGNLEASSWARGQPGYIGTDGRFARFDSPESGWAATVALARNKINRLGSVAAIVSSWAPPGENNTAAYIAAVSKRMGVNPYQRLNPDQAEALARANAEHEGYHGFGPGAAKGKPKLALPNVDRKAMARLYGSGGGGGGDTHVSVHVDARGASDPHKVATLTGQSVKHAMRKRGRVVNANTGVG